LIVFDGGIPRRSTSLIIDVVVGDVNDNSPQFERETYNVDVPENITIGSTVVRLVATDRDNGENGRVLYRLVCEARELYIRFSIYCGMD